MAAPSLFDDDPDGGPSVVKPFRQEGRVPWPEGYRVSVGDPMYQWYWIGYNHGTQGVCTTSDYTGSLPEGVTMALLHQQYMDGHRLGSLVKPALDALKGRDGGRRRR